MKQEMDKKIEVLTGGDAFTCDIVTGVCGPVNNEKQESTMQMVDLGKLDTQGVE